MSHLLAEQAGELFAILDGARDDAVHAYCRESGCEWKHLEDGIIDPTYEQCAPRVVALGAAPSPALAALLAAGWGDSWGVFMRSELELDPLRLHLASLGEARLPDGEEVLFRFYDPRVLRMYLPACPPARLRRVFGPVSTFIIEDEDPEFALRCVLVDGALEQAPLSLGSASN